MSFQFVPKGRFWFLVVVVIVSILAVAIALLACPAPTHTHANRHSPAIAHRYQRIACWIAGTPILDSAGQITGTNYTPGVHGPLHLGLITPERILILEL